MNKTLLGDISSIITGPFGSQLHMEDYVEDGIPVIMPQNIKNRTVDETWIARITSDDFLRLNRYATMINDIIYARRGDVEKHAFVKDNSQMLCGTGCLRVRIMSEDIYPPYLSFYLNRPETKRWITSHAVGSNMPNLNTGILEAVPIEYPDYKSQVRIAAVLQKLEEKIDINNKINDYLEQQRHLIYEHMMFNMLNNMICGKHIFAKDICNVVTGKEDANFATENGKYKFFTCASTPSLCDEYVFESKSILIAGNGEFNVKHYDGKFNAYQRTYVLSPEPELYGLLYLSSLYRINSFKSGSAGSIVKFITKGDVENIPVFIPNDTELIKSINSLVHFQDQVSIENEQLCTLRDWLLPMLMNGQATIED